MTQEVQPLTWQKRTNLEEHQQFFSKINEIIGNLAPTVDEAEQAIAQATQAVASANAAINTANAASASADAASQQAQTAADTVAGYDARMTAVESKNDQQDTAISELQTADTHNVKIEGNQTITGAKTFNVKGDPIIIQAPNIDGNSVPSNNLYSEIDIRDSVGREIAYIIRRHQANGDANFGMVCKHTRLGLSADISAFVTNDGKMYGIAPTPSKGAPSYAIATKAYVESTDGETNNLLHKTANETILSNKTIGDTTHLGYRLDAYGSNTSGSCKINIVGGTDVQSTVPSNFIIYPYMSWSDSSNKIVAGIRAVHNSDGSYSLQAMVLNTDGTEKYVTIAKGD